MASYLVPNIQWTLVSLLNSNNVLLPNSNGQKYLFKWQWTVFLVTDIISCFKIPIDSTSFLNSNGPYFLFSFLSVKNGGMDKKQDNLIM
jgi:hypothetical protein